MHFPNPNVKFFIFSEKKIYSKKILTPWNGVWFGLLPKLVSKISYNFPKINNACLKKNLLQDGCWSSRKIIFFLSFGMTADLVYLMNFNIKAQNSLRRNWMLEQPLAFTDCSSIQFFNLPTFTNTVRLSGVTYYLLCSIYVAYGTTCGCIGHQVLPTQLLPREGKDLPRGGKYPKHVPLLT